MDLDENATNTITEAVSEPVLVQVVSSSEEIIATAVGTQQRLTGESETYAAKSEAYASNQGYHENKAAVNFAGAEVAATERGANADIARGVIHEVAAESANVMSHAAATASIEAGTTAASLDETVRTVSAATEEAERLVAVQTEIARQAAAVDIVVPDITQEDVKAEMLALEAVEAPVQNLETQLAQTIDFGAPKA